MMADKIQELRDFIVDVDADLQRVFPFTVEEVRDSKAGKGVYTVKGHAAVYDKWSLDPGGFREKVARGAFDNVLSGNPKVLHLWDHDTAKALSSTRSKDYPLELRSDPAGLRFFSKVAPTTYAADLRTLLEGGVIDESSFAFTVLKDKWEVTEEGDREQVERTILEVDQLFDVTTCAMGAYPTTDSALAVRSLANRRPFTFKGVLSPKDLRAAPSFGPLERGAKGEQAAPAGDAAPETVAAPDTPAAPDQVAEGVTAEQSPSQAETPEQPPDAVELQAQKAEQDQARMNMLADLKNTAKTEFKSATSRYIRGRKDET